MLPIFALAVLLAIYALGEIVAQKTKAVLSMTLVIALVLLVGFWCGLPPTIFDDAAIPGAGMLLVGILITSLGTRIDFAELRRQWKTVIIGVVGVSIAVAGIILVGQFVIGRDMAMAGAPIFAGANTASLVMIDALGKKGLSELSTFCILMLVTQNFVGIPVASQLLRKEAKDMLARPDQLRLYMHTQADAEEAKRRKPLQLPEVFAKPSVYLCKLALVATVANVLASLTQGKIHYFVFALLLGILFYELGFLEEDSLTKSHASTFILFITTVVIFTNLANTTPQQVLSMLPALLLCLGIGVVFAVAAGFVLAKVLKVGTGLSISIILTCTFGFPTTLFMPQEVAQAIGRTNEEKAALRNYLEPKMITGGFVTVTIFSVILAGIVAGML
ncbi:membrane protein [Oscillospiraceae bacterium]|nr:membrane protein [Oscillospiraceae bacterium]